MRASHSVAVLALLAGSVLGSEAERPTADRSPTPLRVVVDPRVELMSLVFRLAGNEEYAKGQLWRYNLDVRRHFRDHRDHPAIRLATELRRRRGIAYDAPMSLAIHLRDTSSLTGIVSFAPRPVALDHRWSPGRLSSFLGELRDFVEESAFDEFIAENLSYYEDVERKTREWLRREAEFAWFDEFFGSKPNAELCLVIGLLNGPHSYGPRVRTPDGEELYCIVGAWKSDLRGYPVYDRDAVPIVIHEFCHSYVNPLVHAHRVDLEASGRRLFALVEEEMERQAYGHWTTMMHESIVRACVVRYLARTEGEAAAEEQTEREIERGFEWTDRLEGLLKEYESARDRYPTFDRFFPRIIEFFDACAAESADAEE